MRFSIPPIRLNNFRHLKQEESRHPLLAIIFQTPDSLPKTWFSVQVSGKVPSSTGRLPRRVFACYVAKRNPTRLVACISHIRCPRIERIPVCTGNPSPSSRPLSRDTIYRSQEDERGEGEDKRDRDQRSSKEHPAFIRRSRHL